MRNLLIAISVLMGLLGCSKDDEISEKSLEYDGQYNGIASQSGTHLGVLQMTIEEGQASGYYDDGLSIQIDFYGTVYKGGKLDFGMSLNDGTLVDVSMVIDLDKNMTGTWSDSEGESGTLAGSEATGTFNGNYSGTASVGGSQIGDWQMTIENGSACGDYTEEGENTFFSGYVAKDGKLSFRIAVDDEVITSVNATITNGNVIGTWSNTDGQSGLLSGVMDGAAGQEEVSSTHIWLQDNIETVEPNEDLGIPFLNTDNSVSYFVRSGIGLSQTLRIAQNGTILENDPMLSSGQEQELLALIATEGKETLDNGHTVRFAAETPEGISISEDPGVQFYIYMYVSDGSTDIDRIQVQPIESYEIVSSETYYTGRLSHGIVTYSDDNEIHYSFSHIVGDSPFAQYKVGFIVINDQYEVVLSSGLDEIFEYKVFAGPVHDASMTPSTTLINTVSHNSFPPERGINTINGHLIIIKPQSGSFYYVVAPMDHNPSYNDGNQIILKADVRTHVYRYELNGSATWEYVFTSHLPTQNNSKWFYLDRYMVGANDGLICSAQLDVRGKQALLHIRDDGTVNKLFIGGYLHSFNELSDSKIAFSGHANDGNGPWRKFTGIVTADLSFENTNTESIPEFFY